ncbi:MAG: hypothetical protein Q9160_004498 [Pyrenula sp. 1 TL-2023]
MSNTASPSHTVSQPVWLVTGCSTGIGRALASEIALSGQNLVATSRDISRLSYLTNKANVLKVELQVTSKASITAALANAVQRYGRIDVLVNNAGYGLVGDTEGIDVEHARAEFETNFWGPVELSREVVNIMRDVNPRSKGCSGGVVVQMSSLGGWIGFPTGAFYYASKAALELFTESLSREMHPSWGIKFLILEPGGVNTEFASSSIHLSPPHPRYQSEDMPGNKITNALANPNLQASAWSSAAEIAEATIRLAGRLQKGEKDMPLRIPLGKDATELILRDARKTCEEMEACKARFGVESVSGDVESQGYRDWMETLGGFIDDNNPTEISKVI